MPAIPFRQTAKPVRRAELAPAGVLSNDRAMTDRVLKAISDPLSGEDQLLFARAYRDHYADLVSFVRRRVNSDIEAADIAQEAYLRVLRYRDERDMAAVRLLLFRIANNLIGMRARAARARHLPEHIPLEDDLPVVSTHPSQDRQVAGEQQLDRVAAAIEKLPRKCQQAFLLRRFQGMSVQEIAHHMRISAKAVELNITRAAGILRKKIGSDWP